MRIRLLNFTYNKIHILIPVLFLILFSTTKNIKSPYDKVIASDAVGYYAYLPAIFIYDDLSFEFTKDISEKYYVEGRAGKYEFINVYNQKPVNKYWIGLSILWLPFFLIAHFLSLLLNLPDDGYNLVYQYCIGISNFFYLAIGIYYLKKIIANVTHNTSVALLTVVSIILATNLFYYSVVEPGHSHAFSFAFLCLFVTQLHTLKNNENPNYKTFLGAIFIATIVILIRPLNALLLVFSIFLVFDIRNTRKIVHQFLFNNRKAFLLLTIPFIFLFAQLFLWKLQTNFWYVDSYAGESFNLNAPHFFQFLFSFKKGWLLYTPICVFSIAGIFIFYKNNPTKSIVSFSVLLLWVYLLSSWWIWTFGTSFGQRLMIDAYPILAVFFAAFVDWMYSKSKAILVALISFFVVLNVFQTWQQKAGILPSYFVNKNIYTQSFFSSRKHAHALYSEYLVLTKKTICFSISNNTFIASKEIDDTTETSVFKDCPYSATVSIPIAKEYLYGVTKIVFESKIMSNQKQTSAAIVFDISRRKTNVFYQKFEINDFIIKDKFEKMQFLIDVPNNLLVDDMLSVYVYDPSATTAKTTMKAAKLEFLKLLKDE